MCRKPINSQFLCRTIKNINLFKPHVVNVESSLFVRRFKTDPEGYNIQVVKQDRQEY